MPLKQLWEVSLSNKCSRGSKTKLPPLVWKQNPAEVKTNPPIHRSEKERRKFSSAAEQQHSCEPGQARESQGKSAVITNASEPKTHFHSTLITLSPQPAFPFYIPEKSSALFWYHRKHTLPPPACRVRLTITGNAWRPDALQLPGGSHNWSYWPVASCRFAKERQSK